MSHPEINPSDSLKNCVTETYAARTDVEEQVKKILEESQHTIEMARICLGTLAYYKASLYEDLVQPELERLCIGKGYSQEKIKEEIGRYVTRKCLQDNGFMLSIDTEF